MKTIIGIMGPGSDRATKRDVQLAYKIGKLVAQTNAVLLSGGMTGVMEASCRGARECGGITVAVSPISEKDKLNPFIDIALMTGMAGGRNYFNILSSDIVIAIGVGSPGTLSEVAFALQLEKPLIIVGGSRKMRAHISELSRHLVHFTNSTKEVEALLTRTARGRRKNRNLGGNA